MKIKLLVSRAGVGFSQNAGDEIEVSAEEAKRMVESGQAVPVGAAPKEKATSKAKPERAVK